MTTIAIKAPQDLLILRGLTHFERNTLQWLAKHGTSALGDCDCPALRKLAELQLATIEEMPTNEPYLCASCTTQGYAIARLIGGDT